MTQTLIAITDGIRALEARLDAMLAETDGEVTPAISKAIDEDLADLEQCLEEKADNYAALIRELEGRGKFQIEHGRAVQANGQAKVSLAARLKERLKFHLEAIGRTKVSTDRFTINVQKNGGKQAIDVHVPAAELPEPFRVTEYRANEEVIRAALEEGEKLSFAALQARGSHLRIK